MNSIKPRFVTRFVLYSLKTIYNRFRETQKVPALREPNKTSLQLPASELPFIQQIAEPSESNKSRTKDNRHGENKKNKVRNYHLDILLDVPCVALRAFQVVTDLQIKIKEQ